MEKNPNTTLLEEKIDFLIQNSQNPIQQKPFLNIQEASELTGLAVGTIYNKTHREEIPHFCKNRRLYFVREDLIAWIKNQ